MRLTVTILGTELLDITLGRTETPAEFDEYQDAGTTGSAVIGFVRSAAPEWDAPGSYHQFDPEVDDRR